MCECCSLGLWGEDWQLGTAAFWAQQAHDFSAARGRHRLGTDLREEIAVCMLGGYGVPGPVGNAAFLALRDAGLIRSHLNVADAAAAMTEVLSRPLKVASREVHYRFYQQRPKRLAASLAALAGWEGTVDDLSDRELRNRLMELPGLGPKTASWVVRNHRDSNEVAIIDIHIQRAGLAAGRFCKAWTLPRDYSRFEAAFLSWAAAGGVSAADLDAVIWRLLSTLGRTGRAAMVTGPSRKN